MHFRLHLRELQSQKFSLSTPETQLYSFILPLTRNTTTVYRNTLKIIQNIPTKLFTRSNVVKARKPI